MWFEGEFIVYYESKVFKGFHNLHSFPVDGDGVVGGGGSGFACSGGVNDHFFGFGHIQMQVVVRAPLCEVRDGVIVFCR